MIIVAVKISLNTHFSVNNIPIIKHIYAIIKSNCIKENMTNGLIREKVIVNRYHYDVRNHEWEKRMVFLKQMLK